MHKAPGGFVCPRCGNQAHDDAIQVRRIERHDSSSVEVVDKSEAEYVKISETCPRCGNPEAFRSLSVVAGEHAGVRQERSVERLRCTKCQHSWSRT
jgi:DNA-directed RNA polymerase subunit M/transcription elongation factor TFIIS